MEGKVLGRPLLECYGCTRKLVSYPNEYMKLYTCAGVSEDNSESDLQ